MKRVETGPLQINDDWPGIFIRGDRAMYWSMMLSLDPKSHAGEHEMIIKELVNILGSCHVSNKECRVLTAQDVEEET